MRQTSQLLRTEQTVNETLLSNSSSHAEQQVNEEVTQPSHTLQTETLLDEPVPQISHCSEYTEQRVNRTALQNSQFELEGK